MSFYKSPSSQKAFTLIELLIVIGILAILATVVLLVINPAQLIKQTRDANRLTELNQIDKALALFESFGGTNMGLPNNVYVSIPCDQADFINLPVLSPGYVYACSSSANFRKTNGSGWLPVDLTSIQSQAGNLFSALPIDPINIVAGGLYYTYIKGSWALSAAMESERYTSANTINDGGLILNRFETGNHLSLNQLASVGGVVLSSAKNITTFSFPQGTGVITGTNISVSVPSGTNTTSLTPTISVSALATISPLSGVAQNFTNSVQYTVTAQDGTFQQYTVTVTVLADTTAPSTVSNLVASNPTSSSIDLSWTAPGDDAGIGTATSYDLKYSTSSITEGNFASTASVTGEPIPALAGTAQSMTVSGLSPSTTYYFALKTSDEVPNVSAISNSPSGTTLTLVFSCGSNFTDTRDSKVYSTAQIGTQCWMTKNMDVGTYVSGATTQGESCSLIKKYCYGNNESNCATYGGLYQWHQAMCGYYYDLLGGGAQGICPTDWHVPTNAEFGTLITFVGGEGSVAGNALKAGGSSGFNALMSGFREYSGDLFINLNAYTFIWSSNQSTQYNMAYKVVISSTGNEYRNADSTSYGSSIRCIHN